METLPQHAKWDTSSVEITVGLKNGETIQGDITEEHLYYLLAHMDGVPGLTHHVVDGVYEVQELPVRSIRIQPFEFDCWTIVLLSEVATVTLDRNGITDRDVVCRAQVLWGGIPEIDLPKLPIPEVPWSPDFVPDPKTAWQREQWVEEIGKEKPVIDVRAQAEHLSASGPARIWQSIRRAVVKATT